MIPIATIIKTLTLSLATESGTPVQYECQLSKAELVDEPSTEDIETFCGKETFAQSSYKLNIGGPQDWTDVDGICEILHQAYIADPIAEIDFVLALGKAPGAIRTRTGKAKPINDPPFGGDAGSALKWETTLDVTDRPVDAYTPEVVTTGRASSAKSGSTASAAA